MEKQREKNGEGQGEEDFIDVGFAMNHAMDTFGVDKDAIAKNVGQAFLSSMIGSAKDSANAVKKKSSTFW